MLGGRAPGAGLIEAAAIHQRHHREHLGARAQLEDGEEVRVVVAQHIAGHRDRVLAAAGALQGQACGRHRVQDANVQALGVLIGQVTVHQVNEDGVVPALGVQPEDGRGVGGPGPRDRQVHPVAHGGVLGGAGPPDVAGGHLVGQQHRAGLGACALDHDDLHGAVGRDEEGLVVAAVLLGLAGHETHIGHRAHGGRVQSPVGAAVIDDGLVDPGVGGVRDDGERVRGLAVRPPQVAAGPDHGGHGGVDDDVTGHVQVRDAAIGVHHGQARSGGQLGLDGGADLLALGQRVQARQDRGQPVLGPQTRLGQGPPVGGEDPRQGGAHRVTEDDRVGDLHHRGLEVHRQQQVLILGGGHLLGEELIQGGGTHEGGVHDLPGRHRQ